MSKLVDLLHLKEDIRLCLNLIKSTDERLREAYLPIMKLCKNKDELIKLWQVIKENEGLECGEDFPGTFGIDYLMELSKFWEDK